MSIIFVATKHVFCCDKTEYACRDKTYACRDNFYVCQKCLSKMILTAAAGNDTCPRMSVAILGAS